MSTYVHAERTHMRLERFIGFAIRRKQQIDQQIVRNADVLRLIRAAGEPLGPQLGGAGKEIQSLDDALAILDGGGQQDVDVLSAAQKTVEAYRVATHKDVFHGFILKSLQQFQQRVSVWVHARG